jgi:hypothetical protein
MKQVNSNPTINESFTITTYAFSSTGASGTINASAGVSLSALEKGQSILINLTSGGTSNGFTDLAEYFVIPVSSGAIKIAQLVSGALNDVYLSSASGNAGSGVIYPNYKVGGTLFVGTGGNVNIRGLTNRSTGSTSFSLHTNIADGSMLPMMIGHLSASGTTASEFVKWYE